MTIVAIKNGIVKAFSGGQQSQPLNSDGTPTYSSIDGRPDEEQSINGQEVSSLNSKNNDDYDSHNTAPGFLGKIDPRVMSDAVIGLSDGLTVPFALTAGLSSLGDSKLVITGGFAELISGAISMGLGGYLAAKSESDYYKSEVKAEKAKFYSNITEVNHEIEDILLEINQDFSEDTIVSFIRDLKKNPETMVDFLVRFGKGLEEPAENRQLTSALTIGGAYFLGGFIPLIPYFFVAHVDQGLIISVITMAFTLFWFGYVKAQISLGATCSTLKKVEEAVQMMLVGGLAAGSAWVLVRVIG
ncbi:putative membrane protein [Wickerhamomyces ciferrii]|uniref:Membrane protein n=1 Tax=Wickerhamomyces ciferrii (strain ATCC 14091 / BCRC 22168 / CBS 111 / JCM 3599 / NBRC 0793 / NRRL Y-1031 F-60-10) TaxID=1206466 RepID=K0KT19_WICCF|nr:uncharacterized protein BN7_4032 [Wickerhamomyces ciferrii]CCH44468.1 putative membrane protein [Wickerhamomyces ciferrii]